MICAFTTNQPIKARIRNTEGFQIEKNLLFLIPFYIFTYDRRLEEYNADEEKLEALKSEFSVITQRLETLSEQGQLSFYYRRIILEMSEKVVEHLAAKYDKITKGVKSVMGGKVLEYEAKTIYTAGVREGMSRGISQGEEQKLCNQIRKKLAKGQSVEQIADALEESPEHIQKLIREMTPDTV
ncbi:MAG: hypothetical protein LUE90_00145 [Clostridiales bacterium]|nr:hypothetical protein [Clostridiales bacterium]